MKLLLLTDTHGKLHLINQWAEETGADACIHCGDWSFFLPESLKDFSARALVNLITHADISEEEKVRLLYLPQHQQIKELSDTRFIGEFKDYFSGAESFSIPVYGVWGNHEDINIIRCLKQNPLHNLTLLDETQTVLLEGIRFYGIGGNFLEKYLQYPEKAGLPGSNTQIQSAGWQYDKLNALLSACPAGENRIQLTHADPAENPFLLNFARHCGASLTLSGHMHRKEHQIQNLSRSATHINLAEKQYLILEIQQGSWQILQSEK